MDGKRLDALADLIYFVIWWGCVLRPSALLCVLLRSRFEEVDDVGPSKYIVAVS